ncbi:MAG: hypothetical protein KUL78_11200 [Flavobacterium sp.]|nr:hypothetical protein [Flavobacterium sp.]
MNVWYCSEARFTARIIKRWDKDKVRYNRGNVNILKYAYRATTFWAMVNSDKISDANKLKGYPKLF